MQTEKGAASRRRNQQKSFLRVYLSQIFEDTSRRPPLVGKCSVERQFCRTRHAFRITGENIIRSREGHGWSAKGAGESEAGNLWGWITVRMEGAASFPSAALEP